MDKITIGGRDMRMAPGQVEVAVSGEWRLHRSTVSPCGRFQNYKLYRNVHRSPKRVFYLSVNLETGRVSNGHDWIVLQEHYEGMPEWFMAAARGEAGEAPSFPVSSRRRKPERAAVDLSRNPDVVKQMLDLIELRVSVKWPLSMYAQTKREGRYAPAVIGEALGLRQADVDRTLISLVECDMIETVMFDRSKKLKGLRVVGGHGHG